MSSEASTPGERLAAIEAWVEGHEKRCDDRQTAMGHEIRGLKDGVSGLTKGAWGVACALVLQLVVVVGFLFAKVMHWA